MSTYPSHGMAAASSTALSWSMPPASSLPGRATDGPRVNTLSSCGVIPSGIIDACVDVGRLDESGEALIGYWAGARHCGVMTGAVACLAGLAQAASYRKLATMVEPEKRRSLALLRRSGFTHLGSVEHPSTFFGRPLGTTTRFLLYERAL